MSRYIPVSSKAGTILTWYALSPWHFNTYLLHHALHMLWLHRGIVVNLSLGRRAFPETVELLKML